MQSVRTIVNTLRLQAKNAQVTQNLRKVSKVAFNSKYLLYTNVAISVTLSSIGDLLEQNYEIYMKELEIWDMKRNAHMAFSGFTVGIICHHWYKILDKLLVGRSIKTVIQKLFLDQVVCSPIIILLFFASVSIFEEAPLEDLITETREKFLTLYKAEWVVWPPAQIFNFYFLPTRYRVLYDNTISLGYDVFTSHVKHKKHKKESILQ